MTCVRRWHWFVLQDQERVEAWDMHPVLERIVLARS